MTTQIITINPGMLIDIEGAEIPYRSAVENIVSHTEKKHQHNNFSVMRTGRFRKIFNRHAIVYR